MQTLTQQLTVRQLGRQNYEPVWRAMQHYTEQRHAASPDELWLVEHPPVFTQGQAGKAEHILVPGDIPVIQVDRGGQVTYHGPGQQVAYFLIDLRRKKLGVRQLVNAIEHSVVNLLAAYHIQGNPRADAPGVYVDGRKICSLGLRIRKGASFHGLALNVNMDLSPFQRINPCGYQGLEVTQISELGGPGELDEIGEALVEQICRSLDYSDCQWSQNNQLDFITEVK